MFTITIDNVHWPNECPVFGTKFSYKRGEYTNGIDYKPSLDRLDPKQGYTVENTKVISWLANRIKSNANAQQVQAVAAWFLAQELPCANGE